MKSYFMLSESPSIEVTLFHSVKESQWLPPLCLGHHALPLLSHASLLHDGPLGGWRYSPEVRARTVEPAIPGMRVDAALC